MPWAPGCIVGPRPLSRPAEGEERPGLGLLEDGSHAECRRFVGRLLFSELVRGGAGPPLLT